MPMTLNCNKENWLSGPMEYMEAQSPRESAQRKNKKQNKIMLP